MRKEHQPSLSLWDVDHENGMAGTMPVGRLTPDTTETSGYQEGRYERMRNDAIGRHLRALLLVMPFGRMQERKSTMGPQGQDLLKDVDPLFLGISMFDFITERMAIDYGALRTGIVEHLMREAARMCPSYSDEQLLAISEAVLNALTNANGNHEAFNYRYFDPASNQFHDYQFRLIEVFQATDGSIRYALSTEGVTAFIGMLDVDPRISQEADEILVRKLFERGKFDAALMIARRARARTIDYRNTIRQSLFDASRDIRSVDWVNVTLPILSQAREHIAGRQAEEQNLLSAITKHLAQARPEDAQDLVLLKETIESCKTLHNRLFVSVLGANDKFQDYQTAMASRRRLDNIPDLEREVFAPLMALPVDVLSDAADAVCATMSPVSAPPLFDPILFLEQIDREIDAPDLDERDDAEIEVEVDDVLANRFTPEMTDAAKTYLQSVFKPGVSMQFSELIEKADAAELDPKVIMCVVYRVITSLNPSDDTVGLLVERIPQRMRTAYVSGHEFRITGKGNADARTR